MALRVIRAVSYDSCVCTHVSMEYPPDDEEPYLCGSLDRDERLIKDAKQLYHRSPVVMSEFLRDTGYLNVLEKRELLEWAGEDDTIEVLNNGEVVEK